jgi:hypothetical protein
MAVSQLLETVNSRIKESWFDVLTRTSESDDKSDQVTMG